MGKIYIAIYENKAHKFDDWASCKQFIEKKKNIVYKGFTSVSESQEFIAKNIKKDIPFDLKDTLYMYVDGSVLKLKDETKVYGYGVCGVKNNEIVYEDCGYRSGDKTAESYQIGGELLGALNGVEKAISLGEKRVIIVYDYFGIEMWANGTWKGKQGFVQDYIKKMNEYKEQINIDFVHVNSHTNNGTTESNFNNRADELAKEGCKKYQKEK